MMMKTEKRISFTTCFAVLLCMLVLPSSSFAEKVEVIWEYRLDDAFDREAWKPEGEAAFEKGGLHTLSAEGKTMHGARSVLKEDIPSARDGYLLRIEWAVAPLLIGGWGQHIDMEGPFVVEFTGTRPTLNARHRAGTELKRGEEVVMSCDFNRYEVFDWKINGEKQLTSPVPVWHEGYKSGRICLADYEESASESLWKWLRISKVIPEDPLQLKLSGIEEFRAVEADEKAAFLTAVTSPMEKVFREAGDFQGILGGSAAIAAAGRESESFQIVVIPSGNALHGLEASCTDLLQSGGEGRLGAEYVSWNPVGYIQTRESNSSIRRAGWWWPDVLMPAGKVDVEAGYVQPLWFTVSVPDGCPAGEYRGIITIRCDEGEQCVPLSLTVRNFSLPLRGKLKTAFCFSPGIWEMWYAPEAVKARLGLTDKANHGPLYSTPECEDILSREDWYRLYDFLLAHRLSPTQIYSRIKDGRSRVMPPAEHMDYCYERGMNATCLTNVDVLSADPEVADRQMEELEAWIRSWETFIQEKDWPDMCWYVHGFDESEMREDPVNKVDPSIQRVFSMLRDEFPWLKRESANPINEKHYGLINVWTPLTQQLPKEKMETVRERQVAGDEVWAYVWCGPGKPYANLFIDFPGVDPRMLPWQYYQQGITGFLYYLINIYDGQENWNTEGPKWPERPWNPYSFKTNSDGILMYPGPEREPLASMRMANLRDGIEDYEALAMLEEIAGRASVEEHAAFLEKARLVLQVKEEVTRSWTEYSQDPEVLVRARHEVDALIEEGIMLLEEE
ncbi:MAG: DUF4091 domain-containing protein [Candidatus Hydrogenedens sp.]|nr:DUF4091 domain-containing protein [Candidatus Hydrogenedens sp.]